MMSTLRSPRRIAPFAGVIAGLVFTATASAQEAEAEVGGSVTTFGIGDWFGLIVRLALVVSIIWGAVIAMRWYVRRTSGASGRRGSIRAMDIVETHALGPNRALHLVRLGDRAVLVGATPERITSLLTIDDPDEVRRLTDSPVEEPRRTAVAGPFSSLVSNLGAGFVAMNARRSQLNARRAELRAEAAGDSGAPRAAKPSAAARLNRLRGVLSRPAVPAAPAPAPAPVERPRSSLFERTLASAEAAEAASPTVAGLRARAGYGRLNDVDGEREPASANGEVSGAFDARASRIADLQRAIQAARQNVG